MGRNSLLAAAAMRAYNFTDEEHAEFVRQTLHRLVLHEVGHTLGMSHNMHASTMLSPDELKDAAKVAENGMCNSVMEYPSINFARNKAEQTRFYDDSPGPYDKWVIEYGYNYKTRRRGCRSGAVECHFGALDGSVVAVWQRRRRHAQHGTRHQS